MSRNSGIAWRPAALGLLALLAIVFPACGSGSSEGTVVRFWALGAEGDNVRQLIPEFERRNPGITVMFKHSPGPRLTKSY